MQSENLNLEENLMINEIPKTMLGKWKYFFYNLGMSKTIFCRHEGTCMKNCSFGGFKSFLLGFLIKFIINLLALIVSQKKARKNFYDYLMAFFNKSNFHLGGFLGCYSFMNKFLLCFIRRIKNDDAAINSFFSGAIAGFFSLQLQPKSSWALWRVSVWARVFDVIYQELLKKKFINDHIWNWAFIMGTFNTIIGYAFLQEPECLPRDMLKIWFKFSYLHTNDLDWRAGSIEWKKRLLQARGIFSL